MQRRELWLPASMTNHQPWWLLVILLSVTLLYAPTIHYERVFDDHLQIEENLHIRSWAYIGRAFTDHVWSGQPGYTLTNSYRPLYLVWMTANYALFGTDPQGWHTTSLLLYLVAIGGVWWAAGLLLGNGPGRVLTVALFALHPTHVESVAWIASFPDAMLMVFFTLALGLHLQAAGWHPHHGFGRAGDPSLPATWRRGWHWGLTSGRNWLAAAALSAALLTKEFAVFWWPMVFLFHLAQQSGSWRVRISTALHALWPQTFALAGYFVARRLALPGVFEGTPYLPWLTVALTAPLVLWKYVQLLVWPVGLRLEYELAYVTSLTDRLFWLPLMGLLGVGIGAAWALRRSPLALTLLAWIGLPLLPTLNLRHFRPQEFLHDRYLFLPTLGFALLLGWCFVVWLERLTNPQARALASFLPLAGVLVGYGWLTAQYVPYWQNDLVLYRRILHFHPDNVFALGNLSDALRARGHLAEGIACLERAYALAPHEGHLARALGNAYCQAGQFERAIAVLEPWLKGDETTLNQSLACYDYGYALLATGRPREARPYLERAATLAPDDAQIRFILAEARRALGLCPEAAAAYAAARQLAPDRADIAQRQADLVQDCP